jgi:hypothetical protein
VALNGIFGGDNASRFGTGLELSHNQRLTMIVRAVDQGRRHDGDA